MSILELIIFGLATWRLASFFSEEEGLFNVGSWIRRKLGVEVDERGFYAKNKIADEFLCFWCMSLYCGVFWFLMWVLSKKVAVYIASPFALSAFALVLYSNGTRVRRNRL